jgi:hypothetical protein
MNFTPCKMLAGKRMRTSTRRWHNARASLTPFIQVRLCLLPRPGSVSSALGQVLPILPHQVDLSRLGCHLRTGLPHMRRRPELDHPDYRPGHYRSWGCWRRVRSVHHSRSFCPSITACCIYWSHWCDFCHCQFCRPTHWWRVYQSFNMAVVLLYQSPHRRYHVRHHRSLLPYPLVRRSPEGNMERDYFAA